MEKKATLKLPGSRNKCNHLIPFPNSSYTVNTKNDFRKLYLCIISVHEQLFVEFYHY